MKSENSRREFLKKTALATSVLPFLSGEMLAYHPADNERFSLPPLPYEYAALEPHIDTQTMQLHHDKHHAAYVSNLNKALNEINQKPDSLESLFKNISDYPAAVRNNGGGHYNHSMFWKLMKPASGTENKPAGQIADAIAAAFGSFEEFKNRFADAALKQFGSGWAWLVVNSGKLAITSTPNQDNPLMNVAPLKGTPVLGIDVWEHAYYLKYQNKRADYIASWWNVVNWDETSRLFATVK